jgi:hypothetical protein
VEGGGQARSIRLSHVNFIGWEWADGRCFNFHRHSLRPMKVTYLTSAHTSRWKLPILRQLLDKPTEVIVADEKFSFSCSVWFKERLVVPKREALKKNILDEAHTSRYSIHPRRTKMYHDLWQ